MRRTLTIAIATALGAASSTSVAVMLSPRGTGQVLIYPYYTVNHQQTLVSVINTTGHGKALKVRRLIAADFERAYQQFDLLLAPTTPTVAFPLGAKTADPMAMYMNDVCTIPSPLAGHCASDMSSRRASLKRVMGFRRTSICMTPKPALVSGPRR